MFEIANNLEFLKEIGIDKAPNKDELVEGLEEVAQQKLAIRLAGRITPEQAEEFNAIENEYTAYQWLQKNVPDLSDLISASLRELRDELIINKRKVVD